MQPPENRPSPQQGFLEEKQVSLPENKNYVDLTQKKKSPAASRLRKKAILFQLLAEEKDLNANTLREKAGEKGISISRVSAYRAMATYKTHKSLAQSEVRCLRIISGILENTAPGELLSARQIEELLIENKQKAHRSTIYRVLERMLGIGLLLQVKKGRKRYFQSLKNQNQ
ncbi:MAG: hypothetical protein K2X27_05360 [Candidatus Obscuribacterales bacterium]|nr:hypothetical protein [Candidatus Obscuribacterales bacterium]